MHAPVSVSGRVPFTSLAIFPHPRLAIIALTPTASSEPREVAQEFTLEVNHRADIEIAYRPSIAIERRRAVFRGWEKARKGLKVKRPTGECSNGIVINFTLSLSLSVLFRDPEKESEMREKLIAYLFLAAIGPLPDAITRRQQSGFSGSDLEGNQSRLFIDIVNSLLWTNYGLLYISRFRAARHDFIAISPR